MEKAKEKKNNGKLVAIISVIAIAVIGLVVALVLILGGKKGPLIGKWKSEYGSWYYNFTSETRGGYGTDAFEAIPDQEFTYEDHGDEFFIQYDGITTGMTLKYHIEDNGKKLIVVDSFGNDTVYIRQ